MVEVFDGWQKDYEDLEDEDNPFRLVIKIFKLMLKATLAMFKFVMIGFRNVILWMMKKQTRQQQQPMLYPAQ